MADLNEKNKATLEAITRQIQEAERAGNLTASKFISIADENITDDKKIKPILADLENLAEKAKINEQEKDRIKKWILDRRYNNWTVKSHKDYSEQYTTLNSFFPTGYNGLIELEPQTLCTIPARTGHGKTALMINLMIDCIEQHLAAMKEAESENKETPPQYPVVFLSLEMSSEQIGKRIIANRIKAAYDYFTDPNSPERKSLAPLPDNSAEISLSDYMTATDKLNAMSDNTAENRPHNIERLEKRLRKNMKKIQDLTTGQRERGATLKSLDACYSAACRRIEEYAEKGLYFLADTETVSRNIDGEYLGEKKTKDGVKDFLANFPHSVVFIDYLQLMETQRDYMNSWQSIKEICNELKDIAQTNDQIIITGAQFNRDKFDSSGDFAPPERMELSAIREGADIEHISNTVFAIGKALNKSDEIVYFWKLLKRRDGENNYEKYLFYSDMMYCTLKSTNTPATDLKAKPSKKGKETETAEKPKSNYFTPKDDKDIYQNVNRYLKDKYGNDKEKAGAIRKEMNELTKSIFDSQPQNAKDIEAALDSAFSQITDRAEKHRPGELY